MTTYQESGVSIDAGNELVQRIKKIVSSSPLSSKAIGGFSGLFPLPKPLNSYYLSGCCDGVGTKLKIAFLLDRHDTVGIDLVAMNVNDLICTGAKPLFFLDYFACGKLDVDLAEKVILGIQKGCAESNCALLGGETAEMPGFYKEGEYDLAGFALGLLNKKSLLKKERIKQGDCLLGIPSSGLHSNGYSLVRKVFSEDELKKYGEELIAPTKIYVKKILSLLNKSFGKSVKGIAHVTGGGWYENILRVFPKGFGIQIKKGSWKIQEIFERIQSQGNISDQEMFRTFNMGIGLILVVSKEQASKVMDFLGNAVLLGEVKKGKEEVRFT
ncbi:MAG: phosphoribosylformylglycinamidine cyclo-ligase [Elusimicrobia bacterium RIFCSPLOWO2_02_FULL_39_32]|nr:MAG: phosphoribosylformylglycinamidine cyclo-ligase [Elusimicrobia bacterium GWA2_38_7]OGR80633.1 MAG: phosphoribosylformylglycinamidine cyclo-ligase [Elusimicrobia bacterium RIFCSPHIGHO2_02_FULL_39_36]OGR91482.1 MAG: phosphoribosylformylglycinamidine cyclo-ligase [Elusimicrobia bacterium RIFCSPLOWO2_02_FULL_39_32]OGS00737.1 MAG: phosphoribosylformylglycinamidine cyclo-ligase [Elusimicrobia bacterium RIFCSPLOWO2_12_FULL_39_28]